MTYTFNLLRIWKHNQKRTVHNIYRAKSLRITYNRVNVMCKCKILYAKYIIEYPKLNLLTRICVEFIVRVTHPRISRGTN